MIEFKIDCDPYMLDNKSIQIIQWCVDNCAGKWGIKEGKNWKMSVFSFDNKTDALNFAMTWGE